jgi:phospholipase/carboxylesterase
MASNMQYRSFSQSQRHQLEEKKEDRSIVLHPFEEHTHSLIWMHGLGDSAYGFYDIFLDPKLQVVPAGCKVILPTAPERPTTLNNGYVMNSWYDIVSLVRPLDLKENLKNYN